MHVNLCIQLLAIIVVACLISRPMPGRCTKMGRATHSKKASSAVIQRELDIILFYLQQKYTGRIRIYCNLSTRMRMRKCTIIDRVATRLTWCGGRWSGHLITWSGGADRLGGHLAWSGGASRWSGHLTWSGRAPRWSGSCKGRGSSSMPSKACNWGRRGRGSLRFKVRINGNR